MTKIQWKRLLVPGIIIIFILLVDQISKIWIKTHMQIGESIPVFGTWFQIHFVENEGMAFGMSFGGKAGKLILTLFRIIASIGIGWFIITMAKKGARKLLMISIALIFAGAVGNIIDSCFYGLIFNESYYQVAEFMPVGGGYAPFLFGKVVDMLYFPIIDTVLPEWIPIWGGQHFSFFSAIFNIADSAITIGVILLLIDQLWGSKKTKKMETTSL